MGPAGPGRGHGPMGMMDGHRLISQLDDIGASDAQRKQIEAIFDAARKDLRAQAEANRGQGQRFMDLWTAPNIDARALEALRQQQLQQHDKVSARMMQAMVEAGRVLTPEQRAKLKERMAKRMERMKERMQKMEQHRSHG